MRRPGHASCRKEDHTHVCITPSPAASTNEAATSVHALHRQRDLGPAYLEARQMGELMTRDVARWKAVAERIKLALD
jgi:hypothetical protein